MQTWWVNSKSKRITAKVSTVEGVISGDKTAPIFRKFVGQPINNLKRWLKDSEIVLIKDGDK